MTNPNGSRSGGPENRIGSTKKCVELSRDAQSDVANSQETKYDRLYGLRQCTCRVDSRCYLDERVLWMISRRSLVCFKLERGAGVCNLLQRVMRVESEPA